MLIRVVMAAANLIRLSTRGSIRRWRYSLGASLAIGIGFLGMILFEMYMIDVTSMMDTVWQRRFMYGDMIIDASSDAGQRALGPAEQAFIDGWLGRAGPAVAAYARFLDSQGTITAGHVGTAFAGRGYDLAGGARLRGDVWRWDTVAGKPLVDGSGADEVVLGRRLAARLGCRLDRTGDKLDLFGFVPRERSFSCPVPVVTLQASTKAGMVNSARVTVIGISDALFQEIDARLVMLPLATLQRLLNVEDVSYYAVRLGNKADVARLTKDFKAAAAARGLALTVSPWSDHPAGDLYRRSLSMLSLYRHFVEALMSLVALLAVFASWLKAVEERATEIGMLRAVGFHRSFVVGIFGCEAMYTALAGTALGVLAALALTRLVNFMELPYQVGGLTQDIPFRLGFDLRVYCETAALLTAAAALSATLAAARRVRAPLAGLSGPA